jgi:hypothetical protein
MHSLYQRQYFPEPELPELELGFVVPELELGLVVPLELGFVPELEEAHLKPLGGEPGFSLALVKTPSAEQPSKNAAEARASKTFFMLVSP